MWMDTLWLFVRERLNHTSYQLLCTVLAVLTTWFAIKLVYSYTLKQLERPVDFKVPLPPELSADWDGTKWSEIEGKDKEILEGQARGVSA